MADSKSNVHLGIRLLRDAADFFDALGENNADLEEQMDENSHIFRSMANLLADDPMGALNGSRYSELAGKLLQDASGFFRSLAEQNEPLAEQMIENSHVYDQIGKFIRDDPLGFIDNHISLSRPSLMGNSRSDPSLDEILNLCGRFEELKLVDDCKEGRVICEEIGRQKENSSNTEIELKEAACDFCGFTGSKYFFNIIASDETTDGVNKSTACTLCSLVVRPTYAIEHEAAFFAWMPEFSQAGLVRLMRDIYVLRIRGDSGEGARRALQLVKMRCEAAEKKFGAVDSDGFRSILSNNLAHDFGIRLVPRDRLIVREADLEFNRFPQILAYWRRDDQPYGFQNLPKAERRVEVFLNYEEARLGSLGVDVNSLYSDELSSPSPVQSGDQDPDADFEETFKVGREYYNKGDFSAAEEALRRSLVAGHSEFGEAHVKLASLYSWLAAALDSQSKREDAEMMHRKAVEIAERVSGPKDSSTQSHRLSLAMNLQNQSKYSEAEGIHRRRVHYLEKPSAESAVQLGNALLFLGRNLQYQGELTEAIETLGRSSELFKREFGVQSKEAVWGMLAVAECCAQDCQWERALDTYNEINTVSEEVFRQVPKDRGDILSSFALFLDRYGQHQKSERLFRRALALYPSDAELVALQKNNLRKSLAHSLIRVGKNEEARQVLEDCLEEFLTLAEGDKWRIADTNSLLAHARDLSGEYFRTTEVHEAALNDLRENWDEGHSLVASAKLLLAENHRLRKDTQLAQQLCESVISTTNNTRHNTVTLGRAHFRLAAAAQNEREFALSNIDRALEFYSLSVGRKHIWIQEARLLREVILKKGN